MGASSKSAQPSRLTIPSIVRASLSMRFCVMAEIVRGLPDLQHVTSATSGLALFGCLFAGGGRILPQMAPPRFLIVEKLDAKPGARAGQAVRQPGPHRSRRPVRAPR